MKKTWSANVRVEELVCSTQRPDLNPNEHLWDELEHQMHSRPPLLTSAPDLTDALVTQIPTATLQNLVLYPPRKVH